MNEHIHALVGAYAVDAVDDDERVGFEAHLSRCPDCAAELASLREAAARIGETTATNPPPTLRASVLDRIDVVRPLPPAGEAGEPTAPATEPGDELASRRGGSRRRGSAGSRGRWLLAAAAAVALVVGLGVTQPWASPPEGTAESVLAADDARAASVDLDAGARATVTHSEEARGTVIRTEDMPPPPDDSVYQLWFLLGDGEAVDAGLMPEGTGDQTVLLDGDPDDISMVGITVEPAGGSPAPTTDTVATFDVRAAA